MSTENALQERSGSKCELCSATDGLGVFEVGPSDSSAEKSIYICNTCKTQIENPESMDENHWRCLNDSMWSEVPAVQVQAWRVLKLLNKSWASDLVEQLYLDEENLKWAEEGLPSSNEDSIVVKDSNGTRLSEGDDVTLIKDLDVKGGGFTAKRGTLVKNIRLTDNPEHIEGKVSGQQIVLVAKFLKKV